MSVVSVFKIANPSSYLRSDFVDVDLAQLGVPRGLGETDLRLSRQEPDGAREVAFQVDTPFGKGSPHRVLTFLAASTPGGPEDYSGESATYLLEKAQSNISLPPQDLWIKYYHSEPTPDEPEDGCADRWDPERRINGVKLSNGAVEVYVRLVPRVQPSDPINFAGAVTSVLHSRAKRHTQEPNVLSPHILAPRRDLARWGQLTRLVLYPLPWERRWHHTVPLLSPDREYELIYARLGPLRAVIALKSEPFPMRFTGRPFFESDPVDLSCRLYRVISVRPRVENSTDAHAESYQEQLSVRTEEHDVTLAFRAYFSSFLPFEHNVGRAFARLEHVPDFFSVWRNSVGQSWGYGFAADSHCRDVRCEGDTVRWRLQLSHIHNCTTQFMFHHSFEDPRFEPEHRGLHEIGHFGWYERIFKPIEVVPLYKYLPRDSEDEANTA